MKVVYVQKVLMHFCKVVINNVCGQKRTERGRKKGKKRFLLLIKKKKTLNVDVFLNAV